MNKVFKHISWSMLLLYIAVAFSTGSCGSKQSPTGGKEDTDKLKILASIPAEFAEIAEQKVELTFSKTVDKATFLKGFYIYPPINNKKIEYDANVITLKFLQALEKDTNYYITLTTRIKGVRGNSLDSNQTLVYKHGILQSGRISGGITYENATDNGLPVQISLLSADSLLVLAESVLGNSYALEALNPQEFQLKAFIDKNLNGRYDATMEPFCESIIANQPVVNYNLRLAYADTVKAVIRTVNAVSNREYQVVLNKAVNSFDKITIEDTKNKDKLRIFAINHDAEKITLLTAETDSARLEFKLINANDGKGNITDESSITISASTIPDTTAPVIVSTKPRNGASVNNLQPVLEIVFSEIIPVALFKANLKDVDSNRDIPFRIIKSNSNKYQIQPDKPLENYKSCLLTIDEDTTDLSGNKLKQEFKLVFLPIIRD